MWQLFENVSLQSGQEFYETSGTVSFIDREGSKPIVLHAFPDRIPEFNEFYILKLVNISGEGFFLKSLFYHQNFVIYDSLELFIKSR